MPTTVAVEEIAVSLPDFIDSLAPGAEVILTRRNQPVGKLVTAIAPPPPRPAPGLGKGSIVYMSPDFDEPMEEFTEYTE